MLFHYCKFHEHVHLFRDFTPNIVKSCLAVAINVEGFLGDLTIMWNPTQVILKDIIEEKNLSQHASKKLAP